MWLEAFDSDDMNNSCIEHVIHSGKPHELSHEYVFFSFLLIYYHCHSSALHGNYATMGYVSPPELVPLIY